MLLDDLVSVIELLGQRIREHGSTLRENEIRTRTALIDPLLRALGWDVSDPALVTAEYDVRGRRADYALRTATVLPAATIEAKRLGQHSEIHRGQMLSYANEAGIRYAGLTDGDIWELYEVFKAGQLEERRVLNISVATDPPYASALQLLLLWRTNLASGRLVAPAEPIFEPEPPAVPTPTTHGIPSQGKPTPLLSQTTPPATRQPPIVPFPEPRGSRPLAGFFWERGTRTPSAVRFPDGSEYQTSSWRDLVEHTAAWLWSTSKLNSGNIPIKAGARGHRYIVNLSPVHSNDQTFTDACHVSGTPLYYEGNISGRDAINHMKTLLHHCGVSPDTVQFQIGQ